MLNSSFYDLSSSVSHVSPSIHKAHSDSSNDLIPLEGMSAGLIFDDNAFSVLLVLISFTRFWTNVPLPFFVLDPSQCYL